MVCPYNRLSNLQKMYEIPIAPSTLWQQSLEVWNMCGSALYGELLDQAANGHNFHLDDTGAKILSVIAKNKTLSKKERRSCHTTNICVKTQDGQEIVLYMTDNKYCGENFAHVLEKRRNKDHYVKMVVDASNSNIPHVDKETLDKILIAYCWAHARRKFYDLLEYYPEECEYFLEEIRKIYQIDKRYKDSPKKRLRVHQIESKVHVKNIYLKIKDLFAQKRVEPNSSLGKAMTYWLNQKEGLTMFLRVKGISLDNNTSERALRSIIRQRKNSLFFKTNNSAAINSGLASIIATCEANKVNAFTYLNWVQTNYSQVQKHPSCYMPHDYLKYLNHTERIAS